MKPGDLFDQVDLAFYIEPPGGDSDRELRLRAGLGNQLKSQPRQDRDNLVDRKLFP